MSKIKNNKEREKEIAQFNRLVEVAKNKNLSTDTRILAMLDCLELKNEIAKNEPAPKSATKKSRNKAV